MSTKFKLLVMILSSLLLVSCAKAPTEQQFPQNYIISYMVNVPEGPNVKAGTHTEKLYIDERNGNRRVDIIYPDEEQRIFALTQNNKIISTSCKKEGGQWKCEQIFSREVTSFDIEARTKKPELPDLQYLSGVKLIEDKTILGIKAKCYTITEIGNILCYHPEYPNIVLYEEGKDGFVSQATELELKTPDQSLFILPTNN